MNNELRRKVWEKDKYYDLAEKGSRNMNHPGMKLLLRRANGKNNILDLGCGEGTRLSLLADKGKNLTGIDISTTAIRKAKQKNSKIKFITGNVENLPFQNNKFDLVYSAFVFEHLEKPESVIKEAIRVLKPGGSLLVVAPNYGAPNRASPPFIGSRMQKLIKGFINDIIRPDSSRLHWRNVKSIAKANLYQMDWDTTVEPYLGTMGPFIRKLGLRIVKKMSCWDEEEEGAGTFQKLFRLFGEWNIYPFSNWGPHLVLLAKK